MKPGKEVLKQAFAFARERGLVQEGDYVVVTSGQISGKSGSTNMLKIERVGDENA